MLLVACGITDLDPVCLDCTAVDNAEGGAANLGGSLGLGGTVSYGGTPAPGGSATAGASARCPPAQRILVDHVVNARDLGGMSLPSGASVACGALYRGAPLANLSEEGCAAFAELGIRTVVDLRIESERLAKPDAVCVTATTSILLAPLPVPYNVSPADYIADLNALDSVRLAFGAFGDVEAYPVYFHCTWGRDRTGVLGAVLLLALGATREAIMAEYLLSVAGGVGAYPDSLGAVLDEIERRGGVEAYLASAGVTGAQIDVLRARAIARP